MNKYNNKHCKQFVSTGSLIPRKNMDTLIRAFAQVIREDSTLHLDIYGSGKMRCELISLIDKLDARDNIRLCGAVTREELARLYGEADCFILVSRSETFGVAYIEAMASGLPVIASRSGGPEDFVDLSSGIMVDYNDVDGIANALRSVATGSVQYDRSSISARTKEMFSPDRIAAMIEDVYRDALPKEHTSRDICTLFVSRGLPSKEYPLNGIFEFDQAKALAARGLNVAFFAIDIRSLRRKRPWGMHHEMREGVSCYSVNIPVGAVHYRARAFVANRALDWAFKRVFGNDLKPDVIHAHFLFEGYIAAHLSKSTGIPLIITEHSSVMNSSSIDKKNTAMASRAYGQATRVIAVGNSLARSIEVSTGIPCKVIPNIVDTTLFKYAQETTDTLGLTADHL